MKLFEDPPDFRFLKDSLIVLTPIIVICVAIGWIFWSKWMAP